MGMPDTSGLVKLYVSFYQENYLLWIYCKPQHLNFMFQVCILQSIFFNKFYIGQTNNLPNRVSLHNKGRVKSTLPYCPWKLIGSFEKSTRSESIILERKLKNLNREDLIKFIKKYFPKENLASL